MENRPINELISRIKKFKIIRKETIEELGANTKPILTVFNKIDAMTEEQRYNLHNTYMAKENMPVVFMSALNKTNTEELRDAVYNMVQLVQKKRNY